MDPISIAGVVIAALALIFGVPSAIVAVKQLRSRKLAEPERPESLPAPPESLPPPPDPKPARPRRNPTDKYRLENLPTPHSEVLIGRTAEKALLTREWGNRAKRNVLALIAEGGTGKSFLVSRWLAELKDKAPKPYAGADRIFTWSFYSQGSKGQVTSSEGFFSELLRSFGEDPEPFDSLGRADKALALVCGEAMILVLDGVEPLQNPPGHTDAGRFHDRAMGDFVNRLAAQHWKGLMIIASRQKLTELAALDGHAVRHVKVETLTPEDGAAVLASVGAKGPEDEMQAAAREMGGHAFGLVLLGRYLADVIGDGDIRKRDQVKLLYERVDGSDKAKAMLEAYADWFGAGSAETAMLHLLGLFDRPVPVDALKALVAEPVIEGLTDAFHEAGAPPLMAVLRRLEALRVLSE